MKVSRFFIQAFVIVLLVGVTFAASQLDYDDKIDPIILEKLEVEEKVKVDVFLGGIISRNFISEKRFNKILDGIGREKILKTNYPLGFKAELTGKEIFKLAKNKRIASVGYSYNYRIFLEDVIPLIDADDTWQISINGVNLEGTGKTTCVIDTGIDWSHPDLAGHNALGGEFNMNCLEEGPCLIEEGTENSRDLNGHGTKVAGIVAASGGINGVAKGSKLIGLKVFPGDSGGGEIGQEVWNALDWCIRNKEEYDISVISMSFGTEQLFEDYCNTGATASFINLAFNNGIAVVAATGNDGSSTHIASPACVQNAIPVAATDKDDILATYSNRNWMVKLFAPGGKSGAAINTTCLGGGYCFGLGTSFSAPAVSGALAINYQFLSLIGQENSMNPLEMEQVFFDTGDEIIGLPPEDGRRINVYNAISSFDYSIQLDSSDILWNGFVKNDTSTLAPFERWSNPPKFSSLGGFPNSRGDIDWDVSAIPDDARITGITLQIYIDSTVINNDLKINHMEGDSFTYRDESRECLGNCLFYIDMGDGTTYSAISGISFPGFYNFVFNSQGHRDLENELTNDDIFSMGFDPAGVGEPRIYSRDNPETNKRPKLFLTYRRF